MPITKQQAEMISELMVACRPHGANRWDAPGCMAALAKVADRSLPEVVRAATRLAENREARTPMALGGNGPQWREVDEMPRQVVEPFDSADTCGTCGRRKAGCLANPHNDHAFERADAVAARKLDPDSAGSVIAELRDRIRPPDTDSHTEAPTNQAGASYFPDQETQA